MSIYKRICVYLSLFLLAGAVLYYGALLIIPNIIDLNEYKDAFAVEAEKQSGFKISCEDISFKRSFTPYFKIHVHHWVVLYPNDEIFLKINDADIKVKILPLLFKKIVIKDAVFKRPIINITLYKDFTTSLEKYIDPEKTVDTNGFKLDSIIKDTVCERYKLKIFDETTKKTFYLEGDNLKVLDLKPYERINLVLKGSLFEGKKEYINYDIAVKSYIGKTENKLTTSPFKQISDYDVKGSVSGNLEIAKNNNLKGNLSLKDFSVVIDDNVLSNNSADLLFKGEEVEITSSLHTSNKDEAKIKGKFNYGKKKNIYLTTNARKINIEKLQKVLSVISQSLNIPNHYADVKLTGLLNANFTLNSDFKKLKSNGSAEIINAEILHKNLPYKVNRINSQVNFNNNKISIEKAQAYVNSTPVNITGVVNEDVSVDIKAYSNNLDLPAVSGLFLKDDKLPFFLKKGKLSFTSDITGRIDKNISLNTSILLSDIAAVEKKQKLPVKADEVKIDIKSSAGKYSGEVLCSNLNTVFNTVNIYSKDFKFSFNEKMFKIPENVITAANSSVKFNGVIDNYLQTLTGNVYFSGNIAAEDIAKILSKSINQPYKASGTIKTNGNINFIKDEININAQLKSNKDNYLSYLVIKELLNKPSVLSLDAHIKNDDITIKEFSVSEDTEQKTLTRLSVTGQILNKKEPVLKNLKIRIPESITASMNFMGGEEISLNGDITLNNTLKDPDIKGNINIHRYAVKNLYTLVRNANVSLNNDNIRVIAPDVSVNTSKFNILLDIEPKLADVITVSNAQVNSLNLDLNTLFSLIEKERNPFASAVVNVKKGSATINNFKILDLKAHDISSDFTLRNNVLKIEGISAAAYNGKVSGAASYDFNHAQLSLNLIGKGLDIKNSLYDLCKLEDNLGGTADFTTSVSMKTGDYNSVIKSLSGKVTFNAKEGKMGSLGKFEYYMNAQNLLYHGLLNATLNRIVDAVKPDNTARFKTAKGSLFLQNGYLIAEEIRTCGPNMSLYMKGRYNMLSNLANIDIYGRISDDIKSKMGSFADVSISELVNGQPSKKNVTIQTVPASLIDDIYLWNREDNRNTNTFKVNVYGNINYPSSINSFTWIIPDESKDDGLPEFSEIPQL